MWGCFKRNMKKEIKVSGPCVFHSLG
jgi:hypothetical protein